MNECNGQLWEDAVFTKKTFQTGVNTIHHVSQLLFDKMKFLLGELVNCLGNLSLAQALIDYKCY